MTSPTIRPGAKGPRRQSGSRRETGTRGARWRKRPPPTGGPTRADIVVHDDDPTLVRDAAERCAAAVRAAIAARGRATVVLTGGSTIGALYRRLSEEPWPEAIDWPRVDLFWSDERGVPPDHSDSNYGLARSELLAHVAVDPGRVHRMRGEERDLERAAADYEREIRAAAGLAADGAPRFDLVLLGLGADAHVASLFPGSPLLAERERLAGAVRAGTIAMPAPEIDRLTLTPPAIAGARVVLVLVTGARKAPAVHAAIAGPSDAAGVPAQLLRPLGARVTWLLDREAAAELDSGRAPLERP